MIARLYLAIRLYIALKYDWRVCWIKSYRSAL